ncbi:MAG: 2Fe-2S iron-sulfur cluster-binding protein [Geminicoccaceae bacterium]
MSGRRVETAGIEQAGEPVAFTFEGRRVEGLAGESLAAALTAAGIVDWRGTRAGERRSQFCGMGVCQECLVQVDGRPAERACLTPVTAGLEVRRQSYAVDLAAAAEPETRARAELAPDILVIGGGPAGLAAAEAASSAGAEVVLVDERASLGGQYFKPLASSHRFTGGATDAQFRAGLELVRRVEALPVRIIREALVWGAFGAGEIGVVAKGTSWLIRPRRLILATGAYERGVPLPGWTLPGAMTTGACQTLLRAYRVAPGSRVLVAGNGPLNLQVAAELLRAGVDVAALVETAPSPWRRPAAMLAMARTAPDLVRNGFSDLWLLRRRGVPLLHGHQLVRIEGEGSVEAAAVARIDEAGRPVAGSERRFAVDTVASGYGFLPQGELSRALGCDHEHDPGFDQLRVARDADCRSSVPEVFVAGDAGGLGGARVAQAQGAIAGARAAADLGFGPDAAVIGAARAALARGRRFQKALWRLYAAPLPGHALATPETLVCRCEEVGLATLQAAIAGGAASIGALKRRTRAGMGRCQGRYCAPVMAAMIAEATGRAVDEFALMAPRAPIRPVPIAAIAGIDESAG